MNVVDPERSPVHEVYARVVAEAVARGVAVEGGELVGLVPTGVVEAAAAAGAPVPGIDARRALEHVLEL